MDLGRIGPSIWKGTSLLLRGLCASRERIGTDQAYHRHLTDGPVCGGQCHAKGGLTIAVHTAVIDRPQGQALACRDSASVAYDRNPSNSNWTAYVHRVHATESWESAMDPTPIPAGMKSQDDGSESLREVRRPRLNKHDKGKVYLERIKTIGPELLEDLKARELSLINHKRQGPLQAFRARERAREAEEGDYFIPANPSQRPEPLLRELEVRLLGEDLVWLVYEAYGGTSVISGSTGPLVSARWAEPKNNITDTDVEGKVWSLVKLLDLVPMTVSEADAHQVILLGQRSSTSYGQTVLSEVQAKVDSFLGSEEDRHSNASKMGRAESLLIYTPWALGQEAIASEGELAKAAEILGFRASNVKKEGHSHKRASEMVDSVEQPEPKKIKSEDGELQTSVERTRYPSLDSVLREHCRYKTPESQDYQELVDHFRYGKTSALDDLPDEVRIPPRRSFHSQPPQQAYHPTDKIPLICHVFLPKIRFKGYIKRFLCQEFAAMYRQDPIRLSHFLRKIPFKRRLLPSFHPGNWFALI